MAPSKFERYAVNKIASLYQEEDHARIFQHLAQDNPTFLTVDPQKFAVEFLAARLALAAAIWESSCEENKMNPQGNGRIFLRAVTASFQNPKFLPLASAFGDYYYKPDDEVSESILIHIVKRLLLRLELQDAMKTPDGKLQVTQILRMLTEVFEGLKSELSAEFFDVQTHS